MFRADVKFLCIYTKNILNFVVSVPPNQVRESPQKGRHEFFFCGCVVQRAVVCVFTQPPVKNSHSYNRLVWANWWAAGHIPPKTTCNQARAIVYQSVLHTYLFYLPRRFFKNVILSFLPLYVQVRNLWFEAGCCDIFLVFLLGTGMRIRHALSFPATSLSVWFTVIVSFDASNVQSSGTASLTDASIYETILNVSDLIRNEALKFGSRETSFVPVRTSFEQECCNLCCNDRGTPWNVKKVSSGG
jgi:hypothetical protein